MTLRESFDMHVDLKYCTCPDLDLDPPKPRGCKSSAALAARIRDFLSRLRAWGLYQGFAESKHLHLGALLEC